MIIGRNIDEWEGMLIEIWGCTLYNTIRDKTGKRKIEYGK